MQAIHPDHFLVVVAEGFDLSAGVIEDADGRAIGNIADFDVGVSYARIRIHAEVAGGIDATDCLDIAVTISVVDVNDADTVFRNRS